MKLDAKSVVYAHWIQQAYHYEYKCSNCRHRIESKNIQKEIYCPRCGCKMNEEKSK